MAEPEGIREGVVGAVHYAPPTAGTATFGGGIVTVGSSTKGGGHAPVGRGRVGKADTCRGNPPRPSGSSVPYSSEM